MSTLYTTSSEQLPEPTLENPYAQIDWVWRRFMRRYNNPNTLEGIASHLTAYKRYLKAAGSSGEQSLKTDPRFFLAAHWDRMAIYNAEKYWRSRKLSDPTIQGYVYTLRAVVEYAAEINLIAVKHFVHPETHSAGNGTYGAAYSDAELNIIDRLISEGLQYAKKIVNGYCRTGVGSDPRKIHRDGATTENGWTEWDNVVWYFENVLNCKTVIAGRVVDKLVLKEKAPAAFREFVRLAGKHQGGIKAVWERLGVAPIIDKSVILPVMMCLARETGLNTDAIINLSRDCYKKSHPATGFPYVEYFKQRSTGEKQLHLKLLDDGDEESAPHFSPNRSEVVRRCIELLLDLTEPLVADASRQDKNSLMLIQVRRQTPASRFRVQRIDKAFLHSWSVAVRSKLKKSVAADVLPTLNLSRFRATRITEMVQQGHDFFQVQAVAGHASSRTTLQYIARQRIAGKAQREIEQALLQVHQSARKKG
ncbi:MAG: hypothetical protein M3384_18640 [Acidobacteriota bacterium]|nr:hypothetical protein [Acidobacteriota bacterium]